MTTSKVKKKEEEDGKRIEEDKVRSFSGKPVIDQAIAGLTAGGIATLTLHPIDLIKTKMQDGIIKISREEGLRGLFRGLVPALFGASHSALQFMAYEKLKNWRTAKNPVSSKPSDKLPTLDYVWMASISKVFATILTYPYQVVKTRQQISPNQTENQYRGVLDTIKKVHSREGLSGFYKGLLPSTLRVIPNTAVTFLIYESISYYFRSNSP